MCMFSNSVRSVSGTNIFARNLPNGRQSIAYSMTLDAPDPVAMILPLPVIPRSGEHAVRFIDLSGYPTLFQDLRNGCMPRPDSGMGRAGSFGGPMLQVVKVGSFEASYVPTLRDFDRLDPRFRLPSGTWQAIPKYASFGFAVFQLAPGSHIFHPMAFDFPRAHPGGLFFPTVHVHDGRVYNTAVFDHTLYCQRMGNENFSLTTWQESPQLSQSFVKTEQTAGLVVADRHCYALRISGRHPNQDVELKAEL